jgi:hypothetical protein
MTTDLQELGERVAKALGWRRTLYDTSERYVTPQDDPDYPLSRRNPSDAGECFKLCAEFNVWPANYSEHNGDVRVFYMRIFGTVTGRIEHDNTPTGRLNAAIEAVLLAVLAIKEQS